MAKVFGAKLVDLLLILLLFYSLSDCGTTELEGNKAFVRIKRLSSTDQKNQYQSVEQNTTENKWKTASPPSIATPDASKHPTVRDETSERSETNSSVVVPYNGRDQHLLGVDGHGQRKDYTNRTAFTSESGHARANVTRLLSKEQLPHTDQATEEVVSSEQTLAEKTVESIDVPENETVNTLEKHTSNQTKDYHEYYNSTVYVRKEWADELWTEFESITHNFILSQSHRRAVTIQLNFSFPFYGHFIRNVTVATGGFLYTGEYVHSWLAATQYIAPLMANFDTSLTNDSFVRLHDNGTAFTVIWENVYLQNRPDIGPFTFSTTLYKTGDIIFAYFNIPISINAIQDSEHPVKVGLSDAYIIDKDIVYARRKTIYEYHRVNFVDSGIINSTIIYLEALPTCLIYRDCASCTEHKHTTLDCMWCTTVNRCSTGKDRRKQEWQKSGCDDSRIMQAKDCPARGQSGNDAPHGAATDTNRKFTDHNVPHTVYPGDHDDISTMVPPQHPHSKDKAAMAAAADDHATAEPKSVGLALGFIVPICFLIIVVLWVLYAYRNPHTKSGQLLIQSKQLHQYRPSQWSWRRGEARYTAATIHM